MENIQSKGSSSEKAHSISHALRILDEAADDSSDTIRDMIQKDYRRLKNTLHDIGPGVKGALKEIKDASGESIVRMKDKVVDTTKETAKKIDHSAHENPWTFVASTAAITGIVGFLLGRKSKQ